MQTLRPVLWIWPCTATLLLLNQPQLMKLHSNSFEENVPSSRPSLNEEIENFDNFGVLIYNSECDFYVGNTRVVESGFCHVFYEGQVKGIK